MNDNPLDKIKQQIEKLSIIQQLEILKILHQNNDVKLNENKSGVYVNLSFLPTSAVSSIREYLNYVTDQEQSLNVMETQKEDVKQTYFEDTV
jgi:hypothetical protein